MQFAQLSGHFFKAKHHLKKFVLFKTEVKNMGTGNTALTERTAIACLRLPPSADREKPTVNRQGTE